MAKTMRIDCQIMIVVHKKARSQFPTNVIIAYNGNSEADDFSFGNFLFHSLVYNVITIGIKRLDHASLSEICGLRLE